MQKHLRRSTVSMLRRLTEASADIAIIQQVNDCVTQFVSWTSFSGAESTTPLFSPHFFGPSLSTFLGATALRQLTHDWGHFVHLVSVPSIPPGLTIFNGPCPAFN